MERLCKSGGNVFADLGFPHPEQELLKGLLTLEVCQIIKERNLTQTQAGQILGIGQQIVSKLLNHHLSTVSPERLLGHLLAFDRDIVVNIRPAEKDRGTVSLTRDPSTDTLEGSSGADNAIQARMEDLSRRGSTIFADFGLRQPSQEVLKVLLTVGVAKMVDEHLADGVNIAKLLGIGRESVFKLQKRQFSRYSVGQLIEYLLALGQDVAISVRHVRQGGIAVISVNYNKKMTQTLFPRVLQVHSQQTD